MHRLLITATLWLVMLIFAPATLLATDSSDSADASEKGQPQQVKREQIKKLDESALRALAKDLFRRVKLAEASTAPDVDKRLAEVREQTVAIRKQITKLRRKVSRLARQTRQLRDQAHQKAEVEAKKDAQKKAKPDKPARKNQRLYRSIKAMLDDIPGGRVPSIADRQDDRKNLPLQQWARNHFRGHVFQASLSFDSQSAFGNRALLYLKEPRFAWHGFEVWPRAKLALSLNGASGLDDLHEGKRVNVRGTIGRVSLMISSGKYVTVYVHLEDARANW